jgi:MoxR-like ATPase
VLSDFQVSIPELGTMKGTQIPFVFLTSNNTRELSEALKRRCLFLHIDYPDIDREKEIVRVRVPEIDVALAEQIAKVVSSIAGTRSRPKCWATRCTCCSSTRATSARRARSWVSTSRPSSANSRWGSGPVTARGWSRR